MKDHRRNDCQECQKHPPSGTNDDRLCTHCEKIEQDAVEDLSLEDFCGQVLDRATRDRRAKYDRRAA